jgi:hypothetical protein
MQAGCANHLWFAAVAPNIPLYARSYPCQLLRTKVNGGNIMTRSLFRLLILCALGLAALPAFAQEGDDIRPVNYQINGQVRYANGGGPAFNVTVELSSYTTGGGAIQVQTDRNGKFTFQNVLSPTCNISVHVPGYRDEQQYVDLTTATSAYVQLTLRSDGTSATRSAPAVIDPRVPTPARQEYDAALKEINAGSADKAIPHLQKAIELYKDFQEAYLLLGTASVDPKEFK